MPRIFRVIVPVEDMALADRFYEAVLGLPVDPVVPTRHYFHCEGVILACVDPREHGAAHRPNPDTLYFAVDDLEAVYGRARAAGARPLDMGDPGAGGSGIEKRPWGERSFYCADPFGNPLCFVDAATLFTGSRPPD